MVLWTCLLLLLLLKQRENPIGKFYTHWILNQFSPRVACVNEWMNVESDGNRVKMETSIYSPTIRVLHINKEPERNSYENTHLMRMYSNETVGVVSIFSSFFLADSIQTHVRVYIHENMPSIIITMLFILRWTIMNGCRCTHALCLPFQWVYHENCCLPARLLSCLSEHNK